MKRRVLALLLAHLGATIVATLFLAIRRYVTGAIPIVESLDPVRFLPHLAAGPLVAGRAMLSLIEHPRDLPGKRLAESLGYLLPLAGFYVLFARTLLRVRPRVGFCSSCGYDLRATPEAGGALLARCPECGAVPSNARID